MDNKPLIIEQEFNAPLALVWRAITEKELMKKWYFDISDFKPEVGCKFHFEGGEENKRYVHLCEVLEVIPYKKLKYSWTYEGYTGISFVTFELSSVGKKTSVKLIHEGLETFTNPDFMRDNFMGGWKYLIHESLKEYLENGKALRNW
ncbi:SRPBCC family protein [Aquimarina sp. 2201CG14-23]|uniref:SRPBCC family protein n=1 Tax=Aquimarina mycalae TaxID=3040073 RepID=UPI002477D3D7|nr:SRPBCC domain-containing protein [Aquimarina sp. 2201CG14-23]MDH7447438.1 SRPBCC domain-containing protein [Aquimarina sp. 2201CG14-23]